MLTIDMQSGAYNERPPEFYNTAEAAQMKATRTIEHEQAMNGRPLGYSRTSLLFRLWACLLFVSGAVARLVSHLAARTTQRCTPRCGSFT